MNELKLFEAFMKKEHPFIDTVSGAYEAMWNLWQARVPEGYVVVPKESSPVKSTGIDYNYMEENYKAK